MSDAPKVERKYEGAAGYYSRYRPPYPAALVTVLRDAFRLDGKGRLLDLGCGPGSVAISIAHLFERVVAMDPEPDMLAEGRAVAGPAGIENIEWICGSSPQDLSPTLGTFRVVTMGESFHWMNRRRTLEALYDLVDIDGGVAVLGRGVPLPLPPMTSWRAAVCRVVWDYVGQIPLPWDHVPPPEELHEAYLRRSRFVDQIEHSELFEVEWTVDSIIGNLYSMSFCNRKVLGERIEAFERDLRRTVLAVEPSGIFRGEAHQFFALMAFKR
jgi:ubiquinone/menaquinone biosynthesis C-methylase UbiE